MSAGIRFGNMENESRDFLRGVSNERIANENRFWEIVDRNGPSGLPSDMDLALMFLVDCWERVQALREVERDIARNSI